MKRIDSKSVRSALEKSWSARTSVCFNPEIAPVSYGQCAQTAIVVFEHYGGEILRTVVDKIDGFQSIHFYNCIDGERYDFTADQFDVPNYWKKLKYEDCPSSVEDAMEILLPGQLDEMRRAFNEALSQHSDV